MNKTVLFRLGGLAAVLGGLARIGASFNLVSEPVNAQWLYTAIDVLLLFGVIAIYLERYEKLGFLGLASFGVAVASLSFIGGPDADPFGFNTYEQGAMALAFAMVGLSIAWMREGQKPLWPALCWIGSLIAGGGLQSIPATEPYAFMVAGVLFGAGFAAAGAPLMMRKI